MNAGSVVVQTITRDVFSTQRRGEVFAIIAAVLAFAPGLAPMIGGLVAERFSWKINFLVWFLLGLITWIAAFLRLPETHQNLMRSEQSGKGPSLATLAKDGKG